MNATLWEALTTASDASFAVCDRAGVELGTWQDVSRASVGAAARLRAEGVVAGTRVGCVIENSRSAIQGVLGVWRLGAVVCSLPTQARGQTIENYTTRLGVLSDHAEAALIVTGARLATSLQSADPGRHVLAWESLDRGGIVGPDEFQDESRTAFVQYSSGTTAEPRGCELSARAIRLQLDALAQALAIDRDQDRVASWLPLSHDMGFFGGLILPWVKRIPAWLSEPRRFIARPITWPDDCAAFGATLTVAPNFALDLTARAAQRQRGRGNLTLRSVVVGAEPVQQHSIAAFVDALAARGMSLECITPAYGLAEATLAVSVGVPGRAPRVVGMDQDALLDNRLQEAHLHDPRAVPLVSVGRPLSGTEVELQEHPVGELVVRSGSLAAGYLGDPTATAARFTSRGFCTSDLGFERDGDLFIVGRSDDAIAIAGRKILAPSLEAACEQRAGMSRGSCAAVDVQTARGIRLVLLVEGASHAEVARLTGVLRDASVHAAGVAIDECIFLDRGSLPRTPSGKLQRHRCRALATAAEPHGVLARTSTRASGTRTTPTKYD